MMKIPAPLRLGRIVVIALAVSLLGSGCKQSKPSAPDAKPATTAAAADVATKGPALAETTAPAKATDAGTAEPAAKPSAVGDASDATVAQDAPTEVEATAPAKPFDRKTLESAYLEISCIQKKGQAAKLLAAYKKYGFADPRAWIRAWESQKKSPDYEQWLAALTQKAWKACP